MSVCDFCKTKGQKEGACACCGTAFYSAPMSFIFGKTERESAVGAFCLTDKYLIVRSVSVMETAGGAAAGAAFGVVGVLVAGAIESSIERTYAFYDLQELEKVIYPYHTKTLKKDSAFKFVNKDGSDFIFQFNQSGLFSGKAARGFITALAKAGIRVEDGTDTIHPVCCEQPFLDAKTFCTRVCPSAVSFLKLSKRHVLAQPIVPTAAQTPQPAPAAPYVPPVQPEAASAWQAAWQTPAPPVDRDPPAAPEASPARQNTPPAPQPAAATEFAQTLCPNCGSAGTAEAKFCSRCGTSLAPAPQPDVSSEDWLSMWCNS